MCRRNRLIGWLLLAFGCGLLVGSLLNSDFWCCCFALAAGLLGILRLKAG